MITYMLKGFKGNIDTCSQKQKEYMSAQACVHVAHLLCCCLL